MYGHIKALQQKSETRNVGKAWSPYDNGVLVAMARMGNPLAEMASRFARTENGIRERLKLLVSLGHLSESQIPRSRPLASPPLSQSSASQLSQSSANAYRQWDRNEEETLRRLMMSNDTTLQSISERMGRSEGAIASRLELLGICETVEQMISRVFRGDTTARYIAANAPIVNKKWSRDEELRLTVMWSQKKTLYEITSQLGRTGESVICKMENLALFETRFQVGKRRLSGACQPARRAVTVKREREEPANDAAETCDICMDGKKDCAFVPCGHRACRNCASSLVKCHLCRKDIQHRLNIF